MAWAPDYTDLTTLKTYARVTGSADDAVLTLAITAASRAIDLFTNRQFGLVAEAEERSYTGQWDRRLCRWVVSIDDVMSPATTGMTVSVSGEAVEYTLRPVNAVQKGQPYTSLTVESGLTGEPDEVTVSARWGWTSVPDPVEQACLLQATRIFSRRSSPYGIAGSPDLGSELRLLSKVDADVSVILQPFVRWWAAA